MERICARTHSLHSPEFIEQHPVSLQVQYLEPCFRQIELGAHDFSAPFRKKFTILLIPICNRAAFLTAALPTLHKCTFLSKHLYPQLLTRRNLQMKQISAEESWNIQSCKMICPIFFFFNIVEIGLNVCVLVLCILLTDCSKDSLFSGQSAGLPLTAFFLTFLA